MGIRFPQAGPHQLACPQKPQLLLALRHPHGHIRNRARGHPVLYVSRKLTPAEQKYAAVEREALAVKWAIEELQYYLAGHHFTLVTKHAALQWMAWAKDMNARLTCWFLSLQDFLFPVQHRVGAQYGNADGLSRIHALWTKL